jgi:hypothetical protein
MRYRARKAKTQEWKGLEGVMLPSEGSLSPVESGVEVPTQSARRTVSKGFELAPAGDTKRNLPPQTRQKR